MTKCWKIATVVLLVLGAVGCDRAPRATAGTISQERFVDTYVALSRIDADTAATDSVRAVVLAEHNVTEEQMREFVEARARNPQQLAGVWDQIRERLQRFDEEPQAEMMEEERHRPGAYGPYEEADEPPAPGIPLELPDRLSPRNR